MLQHRPSFSSKATCPFPSLSCAVSLEGGGGLSVLGVSAVPWPDLTLQTDTTFCVYSSHPASSNRNILKSPKRRRRTEGENPFIQAKKNSQRLLSAQLTITSPSGEQRRAIRTQKQGKRWEKWLTTLSLTFTPSAFLPSLSLSPSLLRK